MRLVKRILRKIYSLYLRIRWKVPGASVWLLIDAFISDYKKKMVPYFEIWKIHRKGFTVQDWYLMGLNEANYKKYLSNVEYYKMHPINGEFSKWIDDKLTLKYLCAGTELDRYMPEYFYQIDNDGNFLCLCDCSKKERHASAQGVAELLKEKGTLAFKLIAGSIGEGFYKAEYRDDFYCLNQEKYSLLEFCEQIGKLRNYLVIEYLRPHAEIAKFCPDTVNCIRYLTASRNGTMDMVKSYIRFGTKASGFVENYNAGGVLCYLDESGKFKNGNVMDQTGLSNCVIQHHPDTGVELCGTIPMWEEIEKAAENFSLYFPQLKYLGMDFVVTSNNQVKMLEINSLTSLDGIQLEESILKTEFASFYRCLMK